MKTSVAPGVCCIFFVVMATLPAVASAPKSVAIIEQGSDNGRITTYYENLPRFGWFALVDAGGSRLEPAYLSLKRKQKLNAAEPEDMAVWESSRRFDYLLRHASLKAGPVAQVQLPDNSLYISGYADASIPILNFQGKSYTFDVERLDPANPDLRRITIKTSGERSLLYDWRDHQGSTSENYEIVRWAGDLDRDGRLDLIVEFSSYYNSATCLFLSAPAKPPNLMKRIGCWFTSA